LATAAFAGLVAAFFMTIGQAQTSDPDAAYAFSEGSGGTVADLSGNGNTASVVGATWLTPGRFGSGLSFDGVDDGVSLPVTESLALSTAFTIESWIRLTAGNGSTRQIVQVPGPGGDGLRVMGDGRLRFGATFGGVNLDVTGPASLAPDTWTHVGVSYDGATMRLYVAGVQVATRTATGALAGDQSMWIGRTRGGGNPFAGAIDDVRIYRRVLSVSELWLDMHTPVDPATPFQVSGTTPASGSIAVVSTPITATFSRAVNPSTVTSTSFVLRDGELNAVAATVAYDASTRTATLTPSSSLSPLTTYTVGIVGGETGVTDEGGNGLEADEEWTLTTAAADTVPSAAYAFSEETGDVTFDASGNGHAATLVNGTAWSSGQFGAGLSFDGVNDGVELPKSDALRLTTAFTLEAWVQPWATGSGRQIIQMPGASGDGLKLAGNGRPRFTGTFAGGVIEVTGPSPLILFSWTHVAVTYDGSTLRLFVGGTQVATQTATGGAGGSEAMWIGRARVSGSLFYGGLDEVRIYRRALSASAILVDSTTPVDALAPFQVSAFTPLAGAVGVVGTPISATFSRAIDEATLTSSTFALLDGSQTPVPATVGYDPGTRTATLIPDVPLNAQSFYAARVTGGSSGVLDTSSNPLPANVEWSFQTAADDSIASAAYGLDEGSGPQAFDATGNGHTGTLTNDPVWTTGQYGGALAFDGIGDGVALPQSDALTFTSSVTIEAWVRPLTGAGTARQIVQLPGAGGDGLRLTESGRPHFRAMFPSGRANVSGPTPLAADTWTHVATTYDGTMLRMYVNGAEVATQPVTGELSGTSQMLIGRTRLTGAPFVGSIDEVRVYRRALTAEEIASDMNTPIGTQEPHVVSIAISPDGAAITTGTSYTFTATATYSDETTADVTQSATWTTANELVATVAAGVVTAIGPGITTITAAMGSIVTHIDLRVVTLGTPPVDPALIAPPVSTTTFTSFAGSNAFLYTGADAIQRNVAPATIEPKRAAVVRGKVTTRDGSPLSGVTITVAGGPQYGSTASRDDGEFDIAVNGGSRLTIVYSKTGFLTAERAVDVPWADFAVAEDAALVPLDSQVTTVDLSAPVAVQVAQGSSVNDDDGTRRATMLFPQGTTATLSMPDGTLQPLSTLHVRATEYTVGSGGQAAMPAPLPPTSAYTYAVELSADEAIAAGATSVQFNTAIPVYVENFLGFPTGTAVPSGYYDRRLAAWVPSDNGLVVRIVGIDGSGRAEIDIDGDNSAESPGTLAAVGITDNERLTLASTYPSNQSLWRVPVTHFTPWDFNFSGPYLAQGTTQSQPDIPDRLTKTPNPTERCGSIVECQSQTLGEEIPIIGTPFTLTYRSDRAEGGNAGQSVEITLTQETVASSLQSIEVRTTIAGRQLTQTIAAEPNRRISIDWDGRDVYGRPAFGRQSMSVSVRYDYEGVYMMSDALRAFALAGGDVSTIPSRGPVTRLFLKSVELEGTPPSNLAVAGWSLTPHHVYDMQGGLLYRGDGRQNRANAWGLIVNGLSTPPDILGAPGSDGKFYRIEPGPQGGYALSRRTAEGMVETISAQPPLGPAGGASSFALAAGPGDTIYYARFCCGNSEMWDDLYVGKYSHNGTHTPIATISPARLFMGFSAQIAVGGDGTVYVRGGWDSNFRERILRIAPGAASITTVVTLDDAGLSGLALGADGSLYWSENDSVGNDLVGRIKRLLPSGDIVLVGGNGVEGVGEDGAVAIESSLYPFELMVDTDGDVVFLDFARDSVSTYSRIRRIDSTGVLSAIAGGVTGNSGNGGPAAAARFEFMEGTTLARGPNRKLYVSDALSGTRALSLDRPSSSDVAFSMAAEDGSQVYEFALSGRHLRTRHALTGGVLYQFGYDTDGRLISITDGDGLITRVERNGDGRPTAIVAPFGQRTTLTVDQNGHLATVTDPAGGLTTLTTTATGLLTSFKDANDHESTFTYDGQGRLVLDEDAAGGSQTLSRTQVGNDVTSTLTTGLDRIYRYRVEQLATGDERLTNTAPDGTATTKLRRLDGKRETTAADGTKVTTTYVADPRFGMAAPVPATSIVRTPGGLELTTTTSREVTLSNSQDPLTVLTQTETRVVNGRTYQTMFDASSGTFTTTTPAGRTSTSTIDGQGRVTRTQVGSLTPVDYTYDSQGRLTTISQGPRQSSIAYDGSGRPSRLTDAISRSVEFSYDAASRVTSQTLPDMREIGFAYDAKGNVTSMTPPGRPAHTFTHTPVDLSASYTPPAVVGGGATGYTFNVDKQPTAIQRPDGQPTAFSYDTGGRLSTVTFSRGQLQYGYDAKGHVSTLADPGGVNLTFTYDGALPLTESWSGPVAGVVTRTFTNNFEIATEQVNGTSAVSFGYDADRLLTSAGALTIQRDPSHGLITGTTLGTTTDAFEYNEFGEPTRQTSQVNAANLFDVQITRDELGRITRRIETVDSITRVFEYGYDLAGRLWQVFRNGTLVARYLYDSNGNRVEVQGELGGVFATYDAQDRLLTYGSASYTYTANGELATKTIGGQTTSYVYDTLGNLTHVTKPNGDVITYTIDGRGRRVGKSVNGVRVKAWLYGDQLRPIAELDGGGNLISRFVYGAKANVAEYIVKNGETYRVFSDHLGTPRVIVHATTGVVVQRLDVQPFGEIIQDSSPGWQPFGFAGGLYDPDTGLVRLGARDYDPDTSTWLSKDPMLFAGRDANLYGYAHRDAMNRLDPNGLRDYFFGVEIDLIGFTGIEFGFGVVIDGDTWLDSGLFGTIGVGVGANVGIGIGGGFTCRDVEGTSFNIDVNAAAYSGVVAFDNLGFNGLAISKGPGIGAAASVTETRTLSIGAVKATVMSLAASAAKWVSDSWYPR
jgi:RHS repeat-associated protein